MVDGSMGDILIGVGGGGVSVGSVAWYFFQRMFARQDKLEDRIHRIEEQDLQDVKKRVSHIEDNCRAETNAQAIDSMRPVLARIEGKIDGFTTDVAKLQAEQKNTHEYVTHVDLELGQHKDSMYLHTGGGKHA